MDVPIEHSEVHIYQVPIKRGNTQLRSNEMKLYKFVSCPDAVRSIARGSVKFTLPSQLNDPSELAPVMDFEAIRSSFDLLRQVGYSDHQFSCLQEQGTILDYLAPKMKREATPSTRQQANSRLRQEATYDPNDLELWLKELMSQIRERVGVLSLTETFRSLPMWAHYANRAHGFVVAFEQLVTASAEHTPASWNHPKKVLYSRGNESMTFDPCTHDLLTLTKHFDWSYEKEWRLISALHSCQKVPSKDGPIYVQNVDRSYVTEVIFGWNCPPDIRQSLEHDLLRINPRLRLLSATWKGREVDVLE